MPDDLDTDREIRYAPISSLIAWAWACPYLAAHPDASEEELLAPCREVGSRIGAMIASANLN